MAKEFNVVVAGGGIAGLSAGLASARLGINTLILTGDRDPFCTVEAACTAYRTLQAGELGIVPDTGHDITAPIIDAMTAFLIRHSTST